MPFYTTVAGDVFQHKLDECFSKIEQVIITDDDIMIIVYKPDHSDHDQAFTNLLQTAKSVMSNPTITNSSTNEMKWNSLVRHTQHMAKNQVKIK